MKSTSMLAWTAALASIASAIALPKAMRQQMHKRGDGYEYVGDCNTNDPAFTWPERIGPTTGCSFCEFRWGPDGTHALINAIDVWTDSDSGQLSGINFHYSDMGDKSESGTYGTASSSTKTSLVINPGDTISALSSWGAGSGKRVGKIYIETKGGGKLEAGSSISGEHVLELASGLLVGATGGSGDNIDNLGFIFLTHSIKSAQESNVQYTGLPTDPGDSSISSYSIMDATFGNAKGNTHPLEATVDGMQEYDSTYTASSTLQNMFGASLDVEFGAGVPGIAETKVTAGIKWEITTSKTTSTTTTTKQSLDMKDTYNLDPGSGLHCVMSYWYGDIKNVDYTSHVTLTLDDGTTLDYDSTGTVDATSYFKGDTFCKEDNDSSHWTSSDSNNTPKGVTVANTPKNA